MSDDRAPTVRSRVKGATLFGRENARRYVGVLSGEGLLLDREPSNPNDGNAIIVSTEAGAIGYLERSAARRIAPWIDRGWVYTCTCIEQARSWRRLRKIVVRPDTLLVRCVPIAPIALSVVARRTRQLENSE